MGEWDDRKPENWGNIDWDFWEDLIGTVADQELARQVGCTHQNISLIRRRRKLKSYLENMRIVKKELDKAALCALKGTEYTPSIQGKQLQFLFDKHYNDPQEVALRNKIHLLGTDTDPNIAKILGVDSYWLGRRRKTLGIPKYSVENLIIEKAGKLLGNLPDQEIADWLGYSQHAVGNARHKLEKGPCYPKTKGGLSK